MQKLEDVHKTLEALKKERREINKMFKDELSQNERHKELTEEMKESRDEKKRIENDVLANSLGHKDRLDDLKSEIQAYTELLSDLALNMYVKDENVEITDEYDVTFVPFFTVKFKKSNDV